MKYNFYHGFGVISRALY